MMAAVPRTTTCALMSAARGRALRVAARVSSDRRARAAAIEEERARLARRDMLVLANMELVTANVHSITCRVWARQFDPKDLISAGYVKLVELAGQYDPARGVTFKAFARKGVRGAMWELVRRRNWRESSHLSLTPGKPESKNSLPEAASYDLPDTRQTPEELLESSRKHEMAEEAIGTLTEREQVVVRRYYAEDGDLGTIGADLGISASMASLVHRQGLKKMQEYFALRGRSAA
jgi:RNA polymerase sigma factor (sigma-70 family)